MDRELRRGTLEMVLLALLEAEERYGYEMPAELATRSGGAFELSEGTLYPVLYRLEEARLIEPCWRTREWGVPRKYYRITSAGREELAKQRVEWDTFVATVQALLASGGKR